jgi:hypothetical protein
MKTFTLGFVCEGCVGELDFRARDKDEADIIGDHLGDHLAVDVIYTAEKED